VLSILLFENVENAIKETAKVKAKVFIINSTIDIIYNYCSL